GSRLLCLPEGSHLDRFAEQGQSPSGNLIRMLPPCLELCSDRSLMCSGSFAQESANADPRAQWKGSVYAPVEPRAADWPELGSAPAGPNSALLNYWSGFRVWRRRPGC